MKIEPTKICAHEELATVITVGYSYPQKLIPMKILPLKYCGHENLYVYGICVDVHIYTCDIHMYIYIHVKIICIYIYTGISCLSKLVKAYV